MRGKTNPTRRRSAPLLRDRCDIAEDLVRLGVCGNASARMARQLEPACGTLAPELYLAALEGAAVAWGAARSEEGRGEDRARDIEEIQRLMRGFSGELRKLEEGLRIVSAYVVRMQDRAAPRERGNLLH